MALQVAGGAGCCGCLPLLGPRRRAAAFLPPRAVASDGAAVEDGSKTVLGGSGVAVTKLGIGAWSWGDTTYWNDFQWDGAGSSKRVRKTYTHYDEESGKYVAEDVRRQREKAAAAEKAAGKKKAAPRKKRGTRINYKLMEPVAYGLMRKADWYTTVPRDTEIEDNRFWCREQLYIYRDIYHPLKGACRPMFAHDFEYLRTKPHFNQAVYLLEKLNLDKLAQVQCDYDPQLVIQFFCTLSLGTNDAKTIKWMTGDTPCESDFHQWANLLGYEYDGARPCGARFNSSAGADKTKLEDLYGEDGEVGTITGLLPVYDQLVTIMRDFISPSGGNNDAIRAALVELLYHAHLCAQSEDEDTDFAIDVIDFIFHELYEAMSHRKTIPYAPYIMLLIKDQFRDHDLSGGCVDHKVKHPYQKKKNVVGPRAASLREKKAATAARARDALHVETQVRKLNWFQRNVLCMNVAIHKENYQAYKERKSILDNQAVILHKLNNSEGDAPVPSAPVDYTEWESSAYNWFDVDRCLQSTSRAPPPPPADDDDEYDDDDGEYDDDDAMDEDGDDDDE